MSDLTPRQTQILRLVQRFISETGMPPTRAEIARELGFRSANAAEEHLRALARKGVIALVPGTSRGIQLKDTIREQMGLPLIGRVAAGKPIFAEENFEARLQIDPSLFQPRPHYLLKALLRKRTAGYHSRGSCRQKRLPCEVAAEIAGHATDDVLTPREIDVLRRVAGGNANKESPLSFR